MKSSLHNKTVVITGASSGIGEACAKLFSHLGAKVVLAARNEENLNRVALECENETLVVKTDVSIERDCENLVNTATAHFGSIDVMMCNAGISMRSVFSECNVEVIKKVMDTNFWGTVYCTKYALPHLQKNRGSLVGISSIAGFMGLPARTGYSASKYAINGFLESLRIENIKHNLHVLSVCPGFTASNIRKSALNGQGLPQGESPRDESKMMSSKQVALEILKALEYRKRTVLLTGKGISAVWMHKFLPSFLDKMLYREMRKEANSPF